jgi:response regulator RpfG family c-di-GMP phosphodiesterase
MVAMIKNDLDNLIAKRITRLRELEEANQREIELQKKMSLALSESKRVHEIFQQEANRNLTLSRVVVDTQKETLFALGEIIESRSRETANHIRRVAEYSRLLAKLSGMSEREQLHVLHASPMHDAGKIAIPDSVLNKKGKLSDDEYTIMKEHTRMGFNMLRSSNHEIMKHAANIAFQHHEKWNGKGYPRGIHGEEIHPFGRIVALADVFDALSSHRCYKDAWSLEKVLELMRKESGEHFDPNCITLFFDNLGLFLGIRERFPDVKA